MCEPPGGASEMDSVLIVCLARYLSHWPNTPLHKDMQSTIVCVSCHLCVSLRGGESFSKSCSLTKEPEDVTVGFIVGQSLHYICTAPFRHSIQIILYKEGISE